MSEINLGSGKDYIEGWVNVDKNPDCKPDIVMDILNVDFPKESVKRVLAQDVIDHIYYSDLPPLLRKIYGWLIPNGTLNIHTPNLGVIGRLASEDDYEAVKWLYGSDGKGTTKYDSNIIKWSYTKNSLKKILENVGFAVILVNDENIIQGKAYGFRMVALKNECN